VEIVCFVVAGKTVPVSGKTEQMYSYPIRSTRIMGFSLSLVSTLFVLFWVSPRVKGGANAGKERKK
jgi:hypothetical protein